MLKWSDAYGVVLYVVSLVGGAVLSLIVPVKEMGVALLVLIAFDVYLSFRVRSLTRRKSKNTSVRTAIMRGADYLAALVVVYKFQQVFMSTAPLTVIAGTGLAWLELQRINQKFKVLHNFGVLGHIIDRIRSINGNRTGTKGGDRPS